MCTNRKNVEHDFIFVKNKLCVYTCRSPHAENIKQVKDVILKQMIFNVLKKKVILGNLVGVVLNG